MVQVILLSHAGGLHPGGRIQAGVMAQRGPAVLLAQPIGFMEKGGGQQSLIDLLGIDGPAGAFLGEKRFGRLLNGAADGADGGWVAGFGAQAARVASSPQTATARKGQSSAIPSLPKDDKGSYLGGRLEKFPNGLIDRIRLFHG